MEVSKFKKNEVIFKYGDFGSCMYEVRWGKVGIYDKYGEKEQRLLKEVEPGECFGELGLIEVRPRSATAVALERDTQCAKITNEDFSEFFSEKPAKVLEIMQLMSHRIRELSDEVAKLRAKK